MAPPETPRLLPPTPTVARNMSRLGRKDTGPELAIRRELHRRGLRYRVFYPVPGLARRTIDIAFTRWRLAVFVDGCFWHGCPQHFNMPKNNQEWWEAKIAGNVARDADTDAHLRDAGWEVLRLWEHEPPMQAAEAILTALRHRRKPLDAVNLRETGTPSGS